MLVFCVSELDFHLIFWCFLRLEFCLFVCCFLMFGWIELDSNIHSQIIWINRTFFQHNYQFKLLLINQVSLMWSTGFYQRLSILFYKVIVSKIEFIITRGVPEGSPWFCMPHRYFAFSGDEAVSGLTVPADYTTFHVLLDSSNLSLRCPFWGNDLMTRRGGGGGGWGTTL